MEKGKLGLRLSFYGVTAFILAFLGHSTLLFLLAGVVLVAEKNEWAMRQIIQAICLCLVASVVSGVFSIADFFYDIPFIGVAWSTIVNIVNGVIQLVVLICCIIGICRNATGKEANIPLASKFANWAYGIVIQPNFQQGYYNPQGQQFQQGFNPQSQQFQQGFNPQGQPQNAQQAQTQNAQQAQTQNAQQAQTQNAQQAQNAQQENDSANPQ